MADGSMTEETYEEAKKALEEILKSGEE